MKDRDMCMVMGVLGYEDWKDAMCMGLHLRGKIENKQVGDEW